MFAVSDSEIDGCVCTLFPCGFVSRIRDPDRPGILLLLLPFLSSFWQQHAKQSHHGVANRVWSSMGRAHELHRELVDLASLRAGRVLTDSR
jgi:hypothetical protein